MRALAAALLLAVSGFAAAQLPPIGVPPTLEVQRLAPQLVTFFGSNFQNLVNGLAGGTPITLLSTGPGGLTQTVTFTPGGTLSALQIAQTLETARQTLIGNGIATPSAQQVAVTLVGGNLQTATTIVPTSGLLVGTTTTTGTTAAGSAAAGASANTSPAAIIQQQSTPGTATLPGNTSNSPLSRGISDTPPLQAPVTPGAGATTTTTTTGPSGTANTPAAISPAAGRAR